MRRTPERPRRAVGRAQAWPRLPGPMSHCNLQRRPGRPAFSKWTSRTATAIGGGCVGSLAGSIVHVAVAAKRSKGITGFGEDARQLVKGAAVRKATCATPPVSLASRSSLALRQPGRPTRAPLAAAAAAIEKPVTEARAR